MAESSAMSNSTVFSIAKLNGSNYQIWKFIIEKLLKREGTWKAISDHRPTDTNQAAIDEWDVRDDKALSTIRFLVEDAQILHIRGKITAKEAWNALKSYHKK